MICTKDDINDTAKWRDANILVIVTHNKIKLYDKGYVELDVVNTPDVTEDDNKVYYNEKAIDNFGNSLDVIFVLFKHYSETGTQEATLSLIYKNFARVYQLYPDD